MDVGFESTRGYHCSPGPFTGKAKNNRAPWRSLHLHVAGPQRHANNSQQTGLSILACQPGFGKIDFALEANQHVVADLVLSPQLDERIALRGSGAKP
jgi:hypothetical protein